MEKLRGKTLTKGQAQIAKYILENQYTICQKSLVEVSKEIGVSDVSVLRFVRAIGFAGYNDFKNELYSRLTNQAKGATGSSSLRLDLRLDNSSALRQGNLLQQFLSNELQNIEESLTGNDYQVYDKVTDAMMNCRHLYVYGRRGKSAAEHLVRTLNFIKNPIILIENETDVYRMIQDADENDLFIFITLSRFDRSDSVVCKAVKQRKVKLCVISNSVVSDFVKYADYFLMARISSISYFNSLIGVNSICEYLVTLACHKNEEHIKNRLMELETFMTENKGAGPTSAI